MITKLYFNLDKYVLRTSDQNLEKSNILADELEAICGALYLDSNFNIRLIEEKIVNVFYQDLPIFLEESPIFNKTNLLEYLQKELRFTPKLKYEYEKKGPNNVLKWRAKNPKIVDQDDYVLYEYKNLKSSYFKSKKEAEFDLASKILQKLKKGH